MALPGKQKYTRWTPAGRDRRPRDQLELVDIVQSALKTDDFATQPLVCEFGLCQLVFTLG